MSAALDSDPSPARTADAAAGHGLHYIGLMSGTSLDGVDGVVLAQRANGWQIVEARHTPMPADLRQAFLALNEAGPNELHQAALAGNALAELYARTVEDLLSATGLVASDIAAIGAHGQTVRHRPAPPGQHPGTSASWQAYTLQINQPALLAELTGIAVVADFRSRDVAAGGQGAPLVPGYHHAMFARPGLETVVVNIGGMANATVLHASGDVIGFDTGPGNVLMDLWCERHTGQALDHSGAWGATGTAAPTLLHRLQQDPFFAWIGPRSTGRDYFHLAWLQQHLQAAYPAHSPQPMPQDIQATLRALTAWSIARAVPLQAAQVVVCGGGVFNKALMNELRQLLSPRELLTTDELGIPAMQVEAAAFAWLAMCTCQGLPGNITAVTGAKGPRVLGALYPA